MLFATIWAFASCAALFLWASGQLQHHFARDRVILSSLPNWEDYDLATVGMAESASALAGLLGFVPAIGLGLRRRSSHRTILYVGTVILWGFTIGTLAVMLSEDYLP
ncbi:MAG: hypothetical protein U0800_15275 [Isosphaeraceae bacterium]